MLKNWNAVRVLELVGGVVCLGLSGIVSFTVPIVGVPAGHVLQVAATTLLIGARVGYKAPSTPPVG